MTLINRPYFKATLRKFKRVWLVTQLNAAPDFNLLAWCNHLFGNANVAITHAATRKYQSNKNIAHNANNKQMLAFVNRC